MTVSVIVPAFCAEAFIARAIASVLAQTVQDFEVIIGADDGQDYLAILRAQGISDPRLRCVSTGGTGMGSARARNCALSAVKGKWIATLDADDEFFPRHLERLLPLAIKHGLAITQVDYVDHHTGQRLPNHAKPFKESLLRLEDILLACLHTYSSIVFDRQHIDRHWNEPIPLLQDAIFLAACCDILGSVWYVPAPSYRYFRRSDSACNAANATKRFLEAGRIILALLDKGDIPATPYSLRVLRAYIERNDSLERAFEQALKKGEVTDYQDFIGRHLAMLHAPLI